MNTEIHISPNAESLAEFARQWLVDLIQKHCQTHAGPFTCALAGGSTPKRLYQLLSELPDGTIDWRRVVLLWGDERNYPKDHVDSNFRMVKENLLDHIDIPSQNILAVPNPGALPEVAAQQYEALLRRELQPAANGFPVVDCILLGMGEDVHTASLFPNTMALREESRWTVANHVPQLNTWRVTLTPPLINSASHVAFLLSGKEKRNALQTLWHGPTDPLLYPAQLIQPDTGQLWFLVDQAAVNQVKLPNSSAR
jgi:6-phosphogluconolactonase